MRKRNFRILEKDLMKKEHVPVSAFFNAIDDESFSSVLALLSEGTGYGINDVDCTFPGDLDPFEQEFEGVMFTLLDEEVIIDRTTLRYYVQKACDAYLEDYPEEKSAVQRYLDTFS